METPAVADKSQSFDGTCAMAMNAPTAGADGPARLLAQAAAEAPWFEEHMTEAARCGRAGTAALVERLAVMFNARLSRGWAPRHRRRPRSSPLSRPPARSGLHR